MEEAKFTDIHSHVLPNIDDGSSSIEETVSLLAEEWRQGAWCVVATPHFYAQEMSVSDFLRRRATALEKTRQETAGRDDMPRLLYGAEVYYFPGMGKAAQLPELTLEGTRVLLLEMPFAQWTDQMVRDVDQMIERQQLTVLLAHLERFYQFQRDKTQLETILSMPVTIQVNGGCLMDWKRRRIFRRILDTGKPVVLGSDCHNMRHRLPNLEEARQIIARKYSPDLLQEIDRNTDRLLGTE